MGTTNDLGMPALSLKFHGLCHEFGVVLVTQNHIVYLANMFSSVRSLTAAAQTSLHCACVSKLLEQPVNATIRPSLVRKFFPQLSRIIFL